MSSSPSPAFQHGQPAPIGILLVNLGTPDAPTADAVRRYLAQFLSDPRVVEIPRLLWKPILHGIILRVRPAKSARKYATVWTPEGSPLLVWTRRQAAALQARLAQAHPGSQVLVEPAMRYGQPSVDQGLHRLTAAGARRILVLPAYPQYSGATTGSAFDAVAAWGQASRWVPELRFVGQYHDDPAYIQALASSIRRQWATLGEPDVLVTSFHGMPERTLHLGDPYHCQCHKTARLLAEALGWPRERLRVTFQSRFGKAKWLEPATEPTLETLAREGKQHVQVVCPGFSADCLETLEEIAQEGRAAFLAAGGQTFHYLPCLNDSDEGMAALQVVAEQHLAGWTLAPNSAAEREASRQRALALGAAQ